jgi:HlyD family secretion protein
LELASAQRRHEAALARARAAAADVQALRSTLALGTGVGQSQAVQIRAPAIGRVLRVHEPSQRAVQPGTPLIDIGDQSGLEVVAEVLSTDAIRIRPGQTMLLEGWGGPDTLRATVRTVGPGAFTRISALGVEEQRVEVVGILSSSPAALGDGYSVTARIVVWQGTNELRVAVAALFRREDTWMVFRIEDDRSRIRPLRVGERGTEWAQVLDGLAEGENVVLYPSDRVVDGTLVRKRN